MASNARLPFYNGHSIPVVGLGTWLSTPKELEDAVRFALDAGYRHFDAAYAYYNESSLGNAFTDLFTSGKVKREDLFITTKLPPHGMRRDLVKYFLQKQLKSLQLDYVDLYLVHSPIGAKYIDDASAFPTDGQGNFIFDYETDHQEIWKGMEELVDLGLAKSIGISNFNVNQIQRLLTNCRIKPASLQVECHLYFQQNELYDFCKSHGIVMTAYSPIGSPGTRPVIQQGSQTVSLNLMEDPVVVALSKKYSKTPAQVLLRFQIQRDIVVIPKSTNPKRIAENIGVFDFELNEDDMNQLKSRDCNHRILKFEVFKSKHGDHPEFPF